MAAPIRAREARCMNTAKLIAWLVLPLVGLVLLGVLAVWAFQSLLSISLYLIVGIAVAAGGAYLYQRARRAVGPGTRTRMRLDAAAETYRRRNP
jgi:protein-S-isoprenylcysteine O-methyltransferase Ste14